MDKTVKKWFQLKHKTFLAFKKPDKQKNLSVTTKYKHRWRKWFYCWVENSSHMQTAMSKPGLINILLANQREVNNKNELKELNNLCLCSLCTGPNILQYCIYYYTTGLQFMSLVQQSQRKTSSVRAAPSPFWSSDWLTMTWLQLKGVCYTNGPPSSQSANTYICSLHRQNKVPSWQQQGSVHVSTLTFQKTEEQKRNIRRSFE